MARPPASTSPNIIERVIAWALTLRPVRAFLHYSEHRGPMLADSVTYRTLFSVFAGVLLGFSIASIWLRDNPVAWEALIASVDAAIPGIFDIVDPAEIGLEANLTVPFVLSLVGLVGAAIGAIGSTRSALMTLADRVHDDVFWVWVIVRNLILAIIIGVAFVLAAIATFYATAGIGALTEWLGLSPEDPGSIIAPRIAGIVVVFLLDASMVALLFTVLTGMKVGWKALLGGAIIGGVGLSVLQQLSSLFVRGASANPLLATFASLIALLLWLNLSAQVILIASSYMIVTAAESADRVRAKYGASTFALRRAQRAEDALRVAKIELRLANLDVKKEREKALGSRRVKPTDSA